MTVRDLIKQLIELDMDSQVTIKAVEEDASESPETVSTDPTTYAIASVEENENEVILSA